MDWKDFLLRMLVMIITNFILLLIYRKYNLPGWIKKKFNIDTPLKNIVMILILPAIVTGAGILLFNFFDISKFYFGIFQGLVLGIALSFMPEMLPTNSK